MSEIKTKKGFNPSSYQELKDLLDFIDNHTAFNDYLIVDKIGRNLALYHNSDFVHIGKSREIISYIRGLIHGKANIINL